MALREPAAPRRRRCAPTLGANGRREPGGTAEAWLALLPALGAGAALAAYAALAAFPAPGRPPATDGMPLAAAAFGALQLLFPGSRPSPRQLLSPRNWVLLAFFLQLVAIPLHVALTGPVIGVLPRLPGPRAVDLALGLSVAAFASFTVATAWAGARAPRASPVQAVALPRWLVLGFAALGLTGLLLRFGSLAEVFSMLADPARFAEFAVDQQGSVRGAASTFLRPFLLAAVVMAWCAWLDRRAARAGLAARVATTAAAALAVVLVGATYELNRAAFVVPLVAMAAAWSAHVRRISLTALATAGLTLAAFSILPSMYRSGDATASELAHSSASRADLLGKQDLRAELQIYANAPQFPGFLLEASSQGQDRFGPAVLLGSLLTPVPVIGKAFREESGPIAYNRLIYQSDEAVDQIIPFEAEVYLCLGPAGLVLAFAALGLAVARLQRAFDATRTAFDAYAIQFVATWLAFLVQGSLAAVSQVFVYFLWPVYLYAILTRLLARRRPARAGRAPAARGGPALAG